MKQSTIINWRKASEIVAGHPTLMRKKRLCTTYDEAADYLDKMEIQITNKLNDMTKLKQIENIIESYIWSDLDELNAESGEHDFLFEINEVKKDFGHEHKFDRLEMSGKYQILSDEDESGFYLKLGRISDVKILADGEDVRCKKIENMLTKEVGNSINHKLN